MVMEIASEVYGRVTGGAVSKPNTDAQVIISLADEDSDKLYYNIYRDDVLAIINEHMSPEDTIEEIRNYFSEEKE